MAKDRPPPAPEDQKKAPRPPAAAAITSQFQQALAFHMQGRLAQAEPLYCEILAQAPDHFDALHLLGVLEGQRENAAAAVELIGRAITINPLNADAHSNIGNAFLDLKRPEEALASYDRALQLRPDFAEAHLNRGNALRDLKRPEEALASYDRALALKPDYHEALYNRGIALRDLNRHEKALASYDRALALNPHYLKAIIHRGNALRDLNRHEEALASYDRALALKPDHHEALYNRGIALRDLNRHENALASYDRALTLKPDYPEALLNRGVVLQELNRKAEALAAYDRILVLHPGHHKALYNRGSVSRDLKHPEDAVRSFAKLLELAPDYGFAKGELLHSKMLSCDWSGLTSLAASIKHDLQAGKKSAEPFGYQAISRSAHLLRRCAEIYAAAKYPPSTVKLWNGERHGNAKIRLGYLSGEFIQHSILILMVELFERHDRNRFELFAFDNGPDDASEIRGRFKQVFDEIVDVTRLGDLEAATAIRQRKIDILVNLNGYFGRARQGIFAFRPCPVQVNYLGFPGTIGADYIDYIIADREVIPPEEQACYSEKVVYLPDTYQVNDSKRRIAERTPDRAEVGLPETGFVFCCFNNNYKITPEMFDIGMRLLNKVPRSVLWLFEENAAVGRNLGREAGARGVAPERLVFAKLIPLDQHLARLRLADLFLDTLPYDAHTTGSVALWAGLPMLTCVGTTFPGRVAASLLKAIGMPELIASSLEDYEALALRLATHPTQLAEIRARLERNRATHPLFDTERYRRHIESAYITMWERAERGEPPAGFAVRP